MLTDEQIACKDILNLSRIGTTGKTPVGETRVVKEMLQFFDKEVKKNFKLVEIHDDYTVHVITHDGRDWLVTRNTEFLHAPVVICDGKKITCDYDFSPACTSVKWLMMLAFLEPDA